jgi:drug/metabolite transporter (DMT)-like permease
MPYVWFVTVCLIWGSSFMLMKLAMQCLTSVEVGAWRAIGGAAILGLFFLAVRRRFTVRLRDVGPLLGVVVLGFAWPHSLQPYLVERLGGAFVGMSVGFTPLITLIVAIPMLGHWPTARQALGVVGALACLIALMQEGLGRSVSPAELCLVGSVPLTYSIANCLIQRALKHLPPLELTLLCLAINSCALLPLSFLTERPSSSGAAAWTTAVLAVGVLGVVGTGLATFLFNKLVQEQGSLFATMTINLTPIGAVLWGWAFHEQITGTQVVALIGVLVMVTFVQFGAARTPSHPSPQDELFDEELPP